jgi:hypothetical protein
LKLTFLHCVLRLLVIANIVPSSLILVTLMMEEIPPKRQYLQEPNGITSQKTAFFEVTTCFERHTSSGGFREVITEQSWDTYLHYFQELYLYIYSWSPLRWFTFTVDPHLDDTFLKFKVKCQVMLCFFLHRDRCNYV